VLTIRARPGMMLAHTCQRLPGGDFFEHDQYGAAHGHRAIHPSGTVDQDALSILQTFDHPCGLMLQDGEAHPLRPLANILPVVGLGKRFPS